MRAAILGAWMASAALSAPAGVHGQPRDDTDRIPDAPPGSGGPSGMPELDAGCAAADEFGGTQVERAAYCQLRRREYVSLRTLADRALLADPESVRAHYLMGVAQHLGEANLAKARFHLEKAQDLFETRYGDRAAPGDPEFAVFRNTLLELVWVYGEMDMHAKKIDAVDRLAERMDVDYSPLKAWPLMKLGRFDEAAEIARRASQSPLSFFRAVGRTALCAIESEQRHRRAAYEACRAAAEPFMDHPSEGAIELTNAGAAAEELGRFDEAERLYALASRRKPEGSVNPYGRLVSLYLRQGRFSESLSAWRSMRDYRSRRPGAHLDQQDEAEAAMLGAMLLMLGGELEEAVRITHRWVERPDRKGTSSATVEQAFAGLALADHVAHRTLAERLDEVASYSPWGLWFELKARAAWHRVQAWRSGRKVLRVLSERERLLATLRPEAPGSIEGPTWLDPWVIELVGSGVARSVIQRNRSNETLPEAVAEPIFETLEATAWAAAGRWDRARSAAASAFETLGPTDAMLKVRAALIEAKAAERAGDIDRALSRWQWALRNDAGMVRRFGWAVPVVVRHPADDPELGAVARELAGSPRFRSARWGLVLRVVPGEVRLEGADGSLIRRVRLDPPDTEDRTERVRRWVHQAHDDLFRPVLDFTQGDMRSLDGVIGGGFDAEDVLDQIMDGAR